MYLSRGLGQITGGYNPCGPGYDFINFQCVKDPNCNVADVGYGVCPSGYVPFVAGSHDAPVSDAEVTTLLAQALANSVTNPVYPVDNIQRAAASTSTASSSTTASTSTTPAASASTSSSFGISTWVLLLAAAAGVGLWLFSREG
jgi:hypothetical protein